MALKTLVKVGDITNLSDARYCAGMGVELLGFNLQTGAGSFVHPEQFKEITEWVAGVKFVGEFTETDLSSVQQAISDYSLEYIQLEEKNVDLVFDLDLPIILNLTGTDVDDIRSLITQMSGRVDYFLLEKCKELDQFEDLLKSHKIFAGSWVEVDDLPSLITTGVAGVALKGSTEEKPGFKDYDQLADILEALEIEG